MLSAPPSDIDLNRLRAAYERAKADLLAERVPGGWWVGELSSSALSTATAVSALAVVRSWAGFQPAVFDSEFLTELITRGVAWLIRHQNGDGGFGDTDLSHSNIATTMLVVAALHLAGVTDEHRDLLARANTYIDKQGRLAGLRKRYGIDKTFVVPIMTNCAIAGLIDWREIDPLPFELACVPQSLYRFVGMPVVSYAIPALVAIGQAVYRHAPPRNPISRFVRWLSINRSLKVLRRMQPDSGGYLEATPLTSFVVMSLAATLTRSVSEGEATGVQSPKSNVQSPIADEVIRHGVKFLANSIRPDGSWPIDTNLATWNTTLAINALAGAGEDVAELLGLKLLDWLLSCQHTKRHSFTGADPGGFGWSDLSGAVPDADDTPGAILAIIAWAQSPGFVLADRDRIVEALVRAGRWLLRLQNRDGGWPTFCRGWGKLPFDRSGTDLTAHVIRAIQAGMTLPVDGDPTPVRHRDETKQWVWYLTTHQHPDGSWSPLWFGNQDRPDEDNPVYGTAKVLMAYRDLGLMDLPEAQRGVAWLVANQNADGGWGSGVWGKLRIEDASTNPQFAIPNPQLTSSIEETALAVESLLAACPNPEPHTSNPTLLAVARGLAWLIDRVEAGQHRQPAPIGFYFAKLWYYEKLYPIIFTVAALGRACQQFTQPAQTAAPSSLPTDRAP
ncbi:MAG: prenyltransferase/squalene oxidase repeat-containing protein [Pirellulaceae bacterium]|nr:prenyltransferase/squalene oxidase repeat-containing protein [Pirellulaceae bacterium]